MIDKSPLKKTWLEGGKPWVSRIIILPFLVGSGYLLFNGEIDAITLGAFLIFLVSLDESWKPSLSARLLKRFKRKR
jgi:hypothetical protein